MALSLLRTEEKYKKQIKMECEQAPESQGILCSKAYTVH